jgi:hypothetical protein
MITTGSQSYDTKYYIDILNLMVATVSTFAKRTNHDQSDRYLACAYYFISFLKMINGLVHSKRLTSRFKIFSVVRVHKFPDHCQNSIFIVQNYHKMKSALNFKRFSLKMGYESRKMSIFILSIFLYYSLHFFPF